MSKSEREQNEEKKDCSRARHDDGHDRRRASSETSVIVFLSHRAGDMETERSQAMGVGKQDEKVLGTRAKRTGSLFLSSKSRSAADGDGDGGGSTERERELRVSIGFESSRFRWFLSDDAPAVSEDSALDVEPVFLRTRKERLRERGGGDAVSLFFFFALIRLSPLSLEEEEEEGGEHLRCPSSLHSPILLVLQSIRIRRT